MASNGTGVVTRVLVTGASGYLGAHIVQQLQKAGYKVRGTVRSTKNEAKIKPLKELCPGAAYELELVEADLQKEDGWASAVADCSHVIHVASPFLLGNPSDEEVIRPAVDGTLVVLKAAVAAKVKRVVLTSSLVSVTTFFKTVEVSEKDWNTGSNEPAYNKSKMMAEKAAWDYVNELPDDSKIELAVINPSLLVGPYLTNTKGASANIVSQILGRSTPALPSLNMPCIDVRDVARAHVIAMTNDAAVGNRHILVCKNLWFQEMAIILAAEFKSQGYNPATKVVPNFLVKVMSWFKPELRTTIDQLGTVITVDNTRMKEVLKIDPIPVEESLIDMGYSIIEKGWVKKTSKYKGRPQEEGDDDVPNQKAADGAPSQEGAGDAPSQEGAGDAPSQEGTGDAPSLKAADGAPSQEGAGDAPSQEGAGDAPSQEGTGDAPSLKAADGLPSQKGAGDAPSQEGTDGAPSQNATDEAPGHDGAGEETPSQEEAGDSPSQKDDDEAPSQEGVADAPSQEEAVVSPSQKGDDEAPSQEEAVDSPSQKGDDEAPSQEGVADAPSQEGAGDSPSQKDADGALSQ